MNCEIIRDLLPLYIEGLTSNSSNEEIKKHLDTCKECKTFYQEMEGEIQKLPKADVRELDFLKKIRRKNLRTVFIVAGTVAVVMLVLVMFFAVGFSASSEDIDMTYQLTGKHLEIDLKLKNGQDLICSGDHRFVYDDNGKVIGVESRYKPVWVFNNPFDDVGSGFSLGTEISNQNNEQFTNTLIIEYSDKNVTFVNGKLVE